MPPCLPLDSGGAILARSFLLIIRSFCLLRNAATSLWCFFRMYSLICSGSCTGCRSPSLRSFAMICVSSSIESISTMIASGVTNDR